MSKGVFITGTGTDIGKTYISALVLKALREQGTHAGYFKAALSGAHWDGENLIPEDAKYVCDTAGIIDDAKSLVAYTYKTAASPHLAARLEHQPIDLSVIHQNYKQIQAKYQYMVVEGSGGIICPLRLENDRNIMLTDVIKMLGMDIIVVAPSGLGAINYTVLTVEYARAAGIKTTGIILNLFERGNQIHEDNKKVIEGLTKIPIIACVAEGDTHISIPVRHIGI